MRNVGVHVSIAGGLVKALERARELGCTAIQIFAHSPRTWHVRRRRPEEYEDFRRLRTLSSIEQVFIHSSYLANLASASRDLVEKSIKLVSHELDVADAIGSEYVVVHPGSASGEDPDTARRRCARALRELGRLGTWRARILLENTAGERGDISSRIRDVADIISGTGDGLIGGVCLDTCHAFAAGYDIRTEGGSGLLIDDIDRYLGTPSLKLLHVNDCRGGLSCSVDRHEHIGQGTIGLDGFRRFLNAPEIRHVPLILETPKKEADDDVRNLRLVRKITGLQS